VLLKGLGRLKKFSYLTGKRTSVVVVVAVVVVIVIVVVIVVRVMVVGQW
jgi:hypothetical protein